MGLQRARRRHTAERTLVTEVGNAALALRLRQQGAISAPRHELGVQQFELRRWGWCVSGGGDGIGRCTAIVEQRQRARKQRTWSTKASRWRLDTNNSRRLVSRRVFCGQEGGGCCCGVAQGASGT